MDTAHTVIRSAKQFFAGTLLSRFSGLFRDLAMAFCFGSSPEIGAFMVAYRLANLFRRLFGEGNLQAGFVPHFETLRKIESKQAFFFYRDTAFSLSIFLLFFILSIEVLLGIGARFFQGEWGRIIFYSMWMAPGLLFVCLSSLNSALLQCQKRYFAPAIAPILFNFVWVGAVLFASRFPLEKAVCFLSAGVTIAFLMQWMATGVFVKKEIRAHLSQEKLGLPRLFSPDWKQLMKPLGLGILGAGAMQVNSTLDAFFAYYADFSGPAYLWYAIRVQQLPLALFGVALSGALLPPLARAIQEGAFERYKELLLSALRQASALIFPCVFGLFALGVSGLNLLYGRGAFTPEDLLQTLLCLWAYGLGLLPAVFVLLFATSLYAKKNYGLATKASLLTVAIHAGCNIFLIFVLNLGAVSIAIATSISSWLNLWLLARGQGIWESLRLYLSKLTLAGVGASVFSLFAGSLIGDGTLSICMGNMPSFARSVGEQLWHFGVLSLVYMSAFLSLAKLFRIEEIFYLLFGKRGVKGTLSALE